MKVTALVENNRINETFHAQHGLSLYIETTNHKILFDVGQDDAFIKNAEMLGINLSEVDMVVISHGHYDHGGGLDDFLKINRKAKIYLSTHAFDEHLKIKDNTEVSIGIKKPVRMDRIQLIDQDLMIDRSIMLISEIAYHPSVIRDEHLFYQEENDIKQEIFNHELYMIIKEDDHNVLFTGCSHKGIEHIIKQIEEKINDSLYTVIGGFHFSHYNASNKIETTYLVDLGKKFKNSKTKKYYACHCTGDSAFGVLKEGIGKKLASLKKGQEIII